MKLREKVRELSPVTKASYALIFAKFFEKGLSMISGPIFTRIMPAAEYGLVSNYISWQSILIIIVTLSLASGVFNNGMRDFEDERFSFMFSLQCLGNLATIVSMGIGILFYDRLKDVIGLPVILLAVMFFRFFVAPAFSFWSCYQKYIYKYKLLTGITIFSSVLSVVLAVLAVVMQPVGEKAVGRVLATEGVNIVIAVSFYIYIAYKAKFKLNFKYWGYALKFNLPLIPHFLAMHILSSADKIMITNMIDSKATAIYSLAYTVASILLIVWTSLDAAYAPWIYEKMKAGDKAAIRARGNLIICFMGGCSIISMLFAPEIIRILGTSEYYSGIYLIPSVVAGVFFTMIYTLYMRLELYCGKTILTMIGTVVSAIVNIGLNYILIPRFGFVAAGYTTMICYILLSVFHYMNVKHLKVSDNYDNRFIFLMGGIVCIVSLGGLLVYKNDIVRWGMIFVMIVVGCIFRKSIIEIVCSLTRKRK